MENERDSPWLENLSRFGPDIPFQASRPMPASRLRPMLGSGGCKYNFFVPFTDPGQMPDKLAEPTCYAVGDTDPDHHKRSLQSLLPRNTYTSNRLCIYGTTINNSCTPAELFKDTYYPFG